MTLGSISAPYRYLITSPPVGKRREYEEQKQENNSPVEIKNLISERREGWGE